MMMRLSSSQFIGRRCVSFWQRSYTEMSASKVENGSTLHRFKLIVAYNGNRYKGFQRQSSDGSPLDDTPATEDSIPTAEETTTNPRKRPRSGNLPNKKVPLTIQESLEDALEQYSGLNRQQLRLRFAGRTDGGVHARGQVVAVSLPETILPESNDELWSIRRSINGRLPQDISIQDVSSLANNPDLDPRKDAIRKRYSYTLKFRRKVVDSNGNVLPICSSGPNCIRSALDPKTLWVSPWTLDDSNLTKYCQLLTGEHDYSAFVHKRSRREKDNVLTVDAFTYTCLEETKEDAPVVTIQFQVEAKGFRRGMVRNLVGFVVDLCRGEVSESIFDTIWSGTDEAALAVHSAPPFGLCLEHVEY